MAYQCTSFSANSAAALAESINAFLKEHPLLEMGQSSQSQSTITENGKEVVLITFTMFYKEKNTRAPMGFSPGS